ncbi:MAG: TonB-dependent receptor, partial [Erythrobacter sp.]|nr:TonB-dependent receptor [Erythrobacter sp.]
LAIPADIILGQTNNQGIGLDIIAYDPSSLLTNGTYRLERATDDTEWLVEEQVHNFYIQADIDGDLGPVPVRGNIGLRYVDTSQSSTGTLSGGAINDVSFSYDNWLPSMNLSFEVMDDTFIRLAFAQTITRARLDQLAANQNITFRNQICPDDDGDQAPDRVVPGGINPPAQVCFDLGGGNPALQPYRSTSFDISFEKYFSPGTAIILAAFHKDLSDWVVGLSETADLSQQIVNAGFGSFLQANPEVAIGQFNGPVNFASGSISGVEGTVRLNFGDFAEVLDGFGGFYSLTYSDATIDPPGNASIPIPGYSDLTWSGDIFYEKNGFRAKLAARYRGAFLSEVPNFAGGLEGADAQSETIVDAQIGYTFDKEGSVLNGLGVLLEVFNLTDEPQVTQNAIFNGAGQQVGNFPSRHELFGRTFQLTLRKNF